MKAFNLVLHDITLLLIRVGLGGLMFWHGFTRWLLTPEGVTKYVDYLGRYKSNATQVTSTNGLTTYLKDRGFVSLTFKTSF